MRAIRSGGLPAADSSSETIGSSSTSSGPRFALSMQVYHGLTNMVSRTHMPSNCSNDVQAVIAHFDAVAEDPTAVAALKAQFGMEDVEHYDDVTVTRE